MIVQSTWLSVAGCDRPWTAPFGVRRFPRRTFISHGLRSEHQKPRSVGNSCDVAVSEYLAASYEVTRQPGGSMIRSCSSRSQRVVDRMKAQGTCCLWALADLHGSKAVQLNQRCDIEYVSVYAFS